MSTTVTSTEPTLARYACNSGCGVLSFQWGRQMPEGGRLGTVSCGQFVNKPIQVFDAQPILDALGRQIGLNWAFQAQDGSFLGRMYVAFYKTIIRFAHFRPNDKWPQTLCTFDPTDPRDSREAIENAA
jgi:hypothetical protein